MSCELKISKRQFAEEIDKALGKRKKHPLEARHAFTASLIRNIPIAIENIKKLAPENDEVKNIDRQLDKLIYFTEKLNLLKATSPILKDIENWTSGIFEQTRNSIIDIKVIRDYLFLFSDFVQDTKILTSSPGSNNRTALNVCKTICKAYKDILGDNPTASKESPLYDISKGTPYERVCAVVLKHFIDFEIKWSTQAQAVREFHDEWLPHKKMFPNDRYQTIRVYETQMTSIVK